MQLNRVASRIAYYKVYSQQSSATSRDTYLARKEDDSAHLEDDTLDGKRKHGDVDEPQHNKERVCPDVEDPVRAWMRNLVHLVAC